MRHRTRFPDFPRRIFSLVLLFGALTGVASSAENVRLRLMAANLSSGNFQSYDPGEGARILDGLNPDIVLLQEFNFGNNTASEIRSFVDATFGPGFSYFREAGAQIPNGIISRYPILSSGEWDDTAVSNRDFAWAQIDVPGARDLWVVSVHLLTTSASIRDGEADQLVSLIQAHVPSSALFAIGGDFNSDNRSESLFDTLSSAVLTGSPYPVDKNNNANTNAGRSKPYDGVYVDTDLSALKTSVVIGNSSFTDGLVVDTRVYAPLSEISPARATDSGAPSMQHMGVVRDFLLPIPEPATGGLLGGGLLVLVTLRRRLAAREVSL